MSFGFSYLEWCTVNGIENRNLKLIYVCLRILIFGSHLYCPDKLLDGEIWK